MNTLRASAKSHSAYFWCAFGLLFAAALYLFMVTSLDLDINAHGIYDSYTLQALAWRDGHVNLPENYSWLEIAVYNGQYFLSFPPVPTLPMLLLTFFFGEQTPSTWLMIACFIGSYLAAFALARRFGNDGLESAILGVFLVCGCNLLDMSLFGWVWYMAQGMNFLLLLVCALCLTFRRRALQALGLAALALAVGCRPFSIVFAPAALFVVYRHNNTGRFWPTIRRIWPLVIVPACIGISYGVYNYVRFDSFFEFGHNYLPEFLEEEQFGLKYIPTHIQNLFFTFPYFENGRLTFNIFNGFAFYIANPLFILLIVRMIRKPRMDLLDFLLLLSLAANFLLLMMHKTFGGWQFGTRYLCDVLPAAYLICARRKQAITWYEGLVMLFGIAFNVYGSIHFRTTYPV